MDSEDDDISILPHCDDDHGNDNHHDNDIDIDAGFHPILPFSPYATASSSQQPHPGSHYALEKAYLTLREKLKNTQAQNVQLARKVQQLELEGSISGTKAQQSPSLEGKAQEVTLSSLSLGSTVTDASFVAKPSNAVISFVGDQPFVGCRTSELESVSLRTVELESFVQIGESFDMMEDARYMGESRGDGGRQLSQGEMEGRLNHYKDLLSQKNQMLNSLSQQVAQLKDERQRLQQLLEAERAERERERSQHAQPLQSLQEHCRALEQERDKAQKEAALLQQSLKKANIELAMAKERGEGGGSSSVEAPVELVNELAHMRRVIDKLKGMVLLQKDCLVNQSMSMSRTSLSRPSVGSSMDLPALSSSHNNPSGSGGSGSQSGHSWEMVNGVTSPPHQPTSNDMLRQQQLQQRSAKMIPVELGPRREGSGRTSVSGIPSGNGVGGNQNGAVLLNIQNGAQTASNQGNQSPLPRRNSENVIHSSPRDPRVSEAAAHRSHTLPQMQQSQRGAGLAQWMGQHFNNRQQQQQQVGLNQFMKDAAPNTNANTGREPSPRVGSSRSPSRHNSQPMGGGVGAQYPPPSSSSSLSSSSANPNPNQRQPSPVGPVSGTYDNIAMATTASSSSSSSSNNTGPSMHILNQSSMTGGRVMQSGGGGSGNFPINTSTTTTTSTGGGVASAVPVAISRDGAGGTSQHPPQGMMAGRGSPQEHSEVPSSSSSSSSPTHPPPPPLTPPARSRNPTDLELNTTTTTTTTTQNIHFVNQPEGNSGGIVSGGGGGDGAENKCPVCNQDFSHITMDEFQTHVFDCFDTDDDMTSNAPETIQAPPQNPPPPPRPHRLNPQGYIPVSAVVEGGGRGGGGRSGGRSGVVAVNERSCPVCFKEFGDNVSQEFFEGHVQSHFEDVIDHFEEIRP